MTYEECAADICALIEEVGKGEVSVEGAKHTVRATIFALTITHLNNLTSAIGRSHGISKAAE